MLGGEDAAQDVEPATVRIPMTNDLIGVDMRNLYGEWGVETIMQWG